MPDRNVEIVRRLEQAMRRVWASGEPWRPALDAFVEPDVDYYPARKFPGSKPCHGIDELAGFLESYRDAWQAVDWEALEVTAVGDDRVLARGRLAGEGRGSGMSLEGEVFICYWLRHGRVFRQEDHLTERGARGALGIPEPASGQGNGP